MLVFLEVELSRDKCIRDLEESIHYQISEINIEDYNLIINLITSRQPFYLSGNHNDLLLVYIKRFEIIKEDELQLYQKIFKFTGNQFTTFINQSLISELICDILKFDNKRIIALIFEHYYITNSDFADYSEDLYVDVLDELSEIQEMRRYHQFLESWLDYIKYSKIQKSINLGNNWDYNLNGIIGEYLNVNPFLFIYSYFKPTYYFFEPDNWLSGSKITLSELEENNEIDDDTINYLKKTGYQTIYIK